MEIRDQFGYGQDVHPKTLTDTHEMLEIMSRKLQLNKKSILKIETFLIMQKLQCHKNCGKVTVPTGRLAAPQRIIEGE